MNENISKVNSTVVELLGMSDLFKRMQNTCWGKCIPDVNDSFLSVGETSCVDRCVHKYMEIHTLVGKNLQESQISK
ncbi:mitochondrial import inner membrane translocase subunit TIM10, putative [Plasmodium malariae]|uniref:Mitochondrial import inner membrane translocase subunit n=1 Tax=Plasmodium malariae TaxID=5858 RepID=A0A1A8WBX8_PLAMA|nr:mitochondrial import inner membrane translocase subunit TIM10, putative [Plasmodium malariae]SBS89235.1 mitochondrial import inner membrane translocase subunit TIM10, putative [Plasmodium malariae]SCP02538.1 mitochondrial import inner membrane translocase subunit TIM10, putative [Plasmodium malariae]